MLIGLDMVMTSSPYKKRNNRSKMSAGIRASMNKFAFLHVQDSSEDSDSPDQVPNERSSAKGSGAKKSDVANSSNATAKKKSRRRKKKNNTSPPHSNQGEGQLQDWVQHDRELVDSLYDEDLKRAIELSKVEFERSENERRYYVPSMPIDFPQQHMAGLPEGEIDSRELSKSASPPKKERRKNKTSKTISLEEFQKHVENSLPLQDERSPLTERKGQNKGSSEDRSDFFEEVDRAASYVKRNDQFIPRRHEEHGKKARAKPEKINKRDQQQQVLAEKDQLITELQEEVNKWEQQFKHVKKRNKQLLVMLQQGEMKGKSELLLEIERLTILRDELTQEVSNLSESLEQERSRSRKLKDEVLKLQGKRSHEDA